MRQAQVVLQGVGKRYGEESSGPAALWALRGVSVALYPGEITVLMGPSGSGKTTLLSLIGGILAPTEGGLRVCGQALENCDERTRQRFRRQHIGFIFQSYHLLASLTGRENVRVALALRGADERQAGALLEGVGLRGREEAYPAQLSGGERQRVAIARALSGDPPVLLADEPTAALDAENGRGVLELLRARAHAAGTTVVVVTHDRRVREFSDRVIELEDGRLKRILRRVRQVRHGAADRERAVQEEVCHAGT